MDLGAIQAHVTNRLDPGATCGERLAGIIGDHPSQYAKSPSLWNAAFRALQLNAVYLPFDVTASQLPELVRALRDTEALLGFNVTVPYKIRILDHLNEVDSKARQIGAVNTVVRTEDGRLVGYNTDGSGFLKSLTGSAAPGQPPLMTPASLAGARVLLIGAGGSARAVAFYVADAIGATGELVVANRTAEAARRLAADVSDAYRNARAVLESEIASLARSVSLIVNCSTKGQSGLRQVGDDRVTLLEPYSALAPAAPVAVPDRGHATTDEVVREIFAASHEDIARNNALSASVALAVPPDAVGYDLVYDPRDTVFCRHLRWSGHRVANGKGTNIAQAVDALVEKVCRGYLASRNMRTPDVYRRVTGVMTEVW